MALVRQELDLPLTVGLAQGQRSEARDPLAGFDVLQNVTQERGGAWTKRKGFTQIANSPSSTIALHSHRDAALVARTKTALHALGSGVWSNVGAVPTLDVTRTGLTSTGVAGYLSGVQVRGLASPVHDTAQAGGVVAIVYATTTALYAATFDATTKAPIGAPVKLDDILGTTPYIVSAQIQPVLVSVSDRYIIALWRRITWPAAVPEDALRWARFDATNPGGGWTASANLIGAGVLYIAGYTITGPAVRPAAIGIGDLFYLAIRDVAGTLLVNSYNSAGANVATVVPFGALQPPQYAIGGDATTVWVAGSQVALPGNVNLIALDSATLATTGTALVAAWPEQKYVGQVEAAEVIGIVPLTSTSCTMVVGSKFENAAPPLMTQGYLGWRAYSIVAGAVAALTNVSTAYNIQPIARPWLVNGREAVACTAYDTFNAPSTNDQFVRNWQKTLFVVDVSQVRSAAGDVYPLANVAPRTVAANSGYQIELWAKSMPLMPGGINAAIAVPILKSGQVESIELVEFAPTLASSSGEVNGDLLCSGGVAWLYDGLRPIEAAFIQTPRVRAEALSAGPGLTGTFLYVAVFEHVDAAGNTHQSAPSAPVTVAAANNTINVIVSTASVTQRQSVSTRADRIRVVLYRTLAGGSTYYRLQEFENYDPASATWFRGYLSHADTLSDTELATHARLYTQPGTPGTTLPRVAPSALRHMVQHGDVIAGIGDSGRRIWFSAPRVEGEGAWFSDAMVAEVEDTSPLVALASLDGRLFAFTRTGIHVIDGAGFSENGAGGYSLPARVASDSGCTEARSVLATPMGVLFQSPQGLSLLSRSGQVSLFGGAVQDTLEAYPEIRAATLDPLNSRAIFECYQSATGWGVELCFDYAAGVWTTSRRKDELAARTAVTVGGLYHHASEGGAVFKANTGFLDGTAWVGQVVETGWIKFTGLQGYQRIWRILLRWVRQSAIGLRVRVAYDYDSTWIDDVTLTEAQVVTAAGRLELAQSRQRCSAIKVRIDEVEPVTIGTGQGLELLGIRFVWAKEARTTAASGSKR